MAIELIGSLRLQFLSNLENICHYFWKCICDFSLAPQLSIWNSRDTHNMAQLTMLYFSILSLRVSFWIFIKLACLLSPLISYTEIFNTELVPWSLCFLIFFWKFNWGLLFSHLQYLYLFECVSTTTVVIAVLLFLPVHLTFLLVLGWFWWIDYSLYGLYLHAPWTLGITCMGTRNFGLYQVFDFS